MCKIGVADKQIGVPVAFATDHFPNQSAVSF